jgi:hypothetical protein
VLTQQCVLGQSYHNTVTYLYGLNLLHSFYLSSARTILHLVSNPQCLASMQNNPDDVSELPNVQQPPPPAQAPNPPAAPAVPQGPQAIPNATGPQANQFVTAVLANLLTNPAALGDLASHLQPLLAANPPQSSVQTQAVPSSGAPLHSFLGKMPLSLPSKFKGQKDYDVRSFIRSLDRYFAITALPEQYYALVAATLLEGSPLRLWESQLSYCEASNLPVTYALFKEFISKNYETLLPAHKFRAQYKALKQTGSVSDFVRELKRLVHELNDTPMKPSEFDIVEKFLDGLKGGPKNYCEINAPQGWWTESEPLFDKAIHYEINHSTISGQISSVVAQQQGSYPVRNGRAPFRGRGRGRGLGGRFQPRYHPYAPPQATGRNPRIPADRWGLRISRGECGYCGRPNHKSWDCTDRDHDSRMGF